MTSILDCKILVDLESCVKFIVYINTVDSSDNIIGSVDRHDALSAGVNFRVVHIFLFNNTGQLLIQQIQQGKRHSGYWGSSVAGYVQFGESYDDAAIRRVAEELSLSSEVEFLAKSTMPEGAGVKFISLYKGTVDSRIKPNPNEISAIKFLFPSEISSEIQSGIRLYTPTFLHIFQNMNWRS